ncbi:MAG: aldo/keto reductase [Candidatus Rifleibacteriota bacterium]
MRKKILGKTGIEVTILAIGTLTMSPMQRGLCIDEGAEVILYALSAGVNFIDTAQMYGSYPQVKAALRRWMGADPVLASKSAAKTYDAMETAVKECLEGTHRKFIDIFLLHAVRDLDDFNSRSGALEALIKAKEKGHIRAIGLSSHSAQTIGQMASNAYIDILHPMINRDGIGILDASLDQMMTFLHSAKENGKGVYAMKPLGGGHLRNDASKALRWLFSQDLVDSAAVGMTTFEEVDMNVALANNKEVSHDFARKVAGQPRKLFINEMICQNCNACVKACQQMALKSGKTHPFIDYAKCILCGYCAPECPRFAIRIV